MRKKGNIKKEANKNEKMKNTAPAVITRKRYWLCHFELITNLYAKFARFLIP